MQRRDQPYHSEQLCVCVCVCVSVLSRHLCVCMRVRACMRVRVGICAFGGLRVFVGRSRCDSMCVRACILEGGTFTRCVERGKICTRGYMAKCHARSPRCRMCDTWPDYKATETGDAGGRTHHWEIRKGVPDVHHAASQPRGQAPETTLLKNGSHLRDVVLEHREDWPAHMRPVDWRSQRRHVPWETLREFRETVWGETVWWESLSGLLTRLYVRFCVWVCLSITAVGAA